MPRVKMDARLAELAFLDVVDVKPDGSFRLNASFVASCLAARGAEASTLEAVVLDGIVARVSERRHAPAIAPQRLARAACEACATRVRVSGA